MAKRVPPLCHFQLSQLRARLTQSRKQFCKHLRRCSIHVAVAQLRTVAGVGVQDVNSTFRVASIRWPVLSLRNAPCGRPPSFSPVEEWYLHYVIDMAVECSIAIAESIPFFIPRSLGC